MPGLMLKGPMILVRPSQERASDRRVTRDSHKVEPERRQGRTGRVEADRLVGRREPLGLLELARIALHPERGIGVAILADGSRGGRGVHRGSLTALSYL